MTDAFAALGIPPHPLPDPDTLLERYRDAARRSHPDAPGGDPLRFAEIEAAYATLSHTPARIAHLLSLHTPPSVPSAPSGPDPLFEDLASCSAALRDFNRRRTAASGTVAKALLSPEASSLLARVNAILTALHTRQDSEHRDLAAIADAWDTPPAPETLAALSVLLPRLTRTARWLDDFTKHAATLRGLA